MKVGIIGLGGIAGAHTRALRQMPEVKITALCDIDEQALRKHVEELGAPGFHDYHELLEADIDAVFICTPPSVHKDPAVAAAQAGKHIFCEKPIALELADADAMIQAAQEARVKSMVGFACQWAPLTYQLKQIFDSG